MRGIKLIEENDDIFSSINARNGTHLPEDFWLSHSFCFLMHDILAQMLVSGESQRVFTTDIEFRNDEERLSFKQMSDIFEWCEHYERKEDKQRVLVSLVFPAILSDALHFIFEVLDCSRKGKLNISYALLRKPIQETLFVMEQIVVDRMDFAEKLSFDPSKLHSQGAGGLEVHSNRIKKVLTELQMSAIFDADYIAQIRYNKFKHDGFDGLCNKAIHLFTTHGVIKTEPLNVNFVFSSWEDKRAQWSYLYTRFPYILFYFWRVAEAVCSQIVVTDPAYIINMERRVAALCILHGREVPSQHMPQEIAVFYRYVSDNLAGYCEGRGRARTNDTLVEIAKTGELSD